MLLLLNLLVDSHPWGLVHRRPVVTLQQRLPGDVIEHASNLVRTAGRQAGE